MEEYLRTYCEIDLKAIRENYINIKKKTGDNAMTMAVIKADGYGHGAVEVAHYLNDIADYFGVATIDEGVELRKAGLKQPILLLGYNSPSLYYKNLEYGVDHTIKRINKKLQTCRRIISKVERGEKEEKLIQKRTEANREKAEKEIAKKKDKNRIR